MNQKLSNFISSLVVMVAGVVLLFSGSIAFEYKTNPHFLSYETSVVLAQSGGDISAPPVARPRPTIPLCKDNSVCNVTTTAISVLVVDDKTDTVLYEKNSQAVRALASITKLMSAMVLLDLPINWSSSTVVNSDDVDSSSHHINAGEKYTIEDLWKIALIGSSNSAVNALVRATSNTTPASFVELMNAKARTLGLNSARFADPTGLDNRNMANASDVVRLLKLALEKEPIITALQTPEYYAAPVGQKLRRVWSTDWLLTHWIPSNYKKVQIAGKTGYIADSNYNFVVRLTNDAGHSVRIVILGASSNESRFTEARDVANWVFAHYLWPEDEGYGELVES